MKNRNGFTLVELLAIIVILAVIMVIAVPQILNVVNDSKKASWKSNVSMIERGIVKNANLLNPETGTYDYSIEKMCNDPSLLLKILKLGDTVVTCEGTCVERLDSYNNSGPKYMSVTFESACHKYKYEFTLTGINQFTGKNAIMTCIDNKCTTAIGEDKIVLAPGLYDESGNLIVNWNDLINKYEIDLNWAQGANSDSMYAYLTQKVITEFQAQMDQMASYGLEVNAEELNAPGWYLMIAGDSSISITKANINDINTNQLAVKLGKLIGNRQNTKLVLDNSVTTINANTFYGTNLTEIVFGSNTTEIKDGALYSAYALQKVTVPKSVKKIGNSAFFNVLALEEVVFEDSTGWKDGSNHDLSDVFANPRIAADFLKNTPNVTFTK